MNLEKIRLSKNLTQLDVAVMAKMSRAGYSNIENGNKAPSVRTAKRIASVLDFDWTLFYQDDAKSEVTTS